MKKNQPTSRLSLDRQTIRSLTAPQTAAVHGGADAIPTWTTFFTTISSSVVPTATATTLGTLTHSVVGNCK